MSRIVVRSGLSCLLLTLFTLTFAGCDSGSDDNPNIIGTWERSFAFGPGGSANFHLTFSQDGSWLLAPEGQTQGFFGSYTLKGERLTIEDPTCTEGPGTYDVRIVNGRLGFTTIEEPCFRGNIFTGSWGPVSAQ